MLKSLKNFGIAFAISAILISIAAMIIMGSIDDVLTGSFSKKDNDISDILNSGDEENGSGGVLPSGDNALTPKNGKSFSILCIMTDYRPDVYDYDLKTDAKVGIFQNGIKRTGAAKICLIKCSKETGRYLVVPFSPLTKVGTGDGYERLYDVYTDYGIDYFKAKIEAMTGIAVDRYAVINCDDISSFVSAIGAVWCSVPCDIYSDGKEYVSAATAEAAKAKDKNSKYERFLEKCDDFIGPSSMGLLLYRDYTKGLEEELSITDSYMRGIMQNFSKFPSESLGSYWENMKWTFKYTDIDSDFMNSHLELIAAYTDELVKTVKPVGVFKSNGDNGEPVFELDQARTVEALANYR